MILRGVIFSFFILLLVGLSLQFFDPYTKIRWCRSRVRSCSKNSFNQIVANETAKRLNPNGVGGNATVPTTTTIATPPKRRRRRSKDLPVAPPDLSQEDEFRFKRQGNDSTPAGNSTGGAEAPAGPPTTTPMPDYPEMISLPPPPLFKSSQLETTFYDCLDNLNKMMCYEYKWQKCNWNDGSSSTIAAYCKKWDIPCTPCEHYKGKK